MKKKMKKLSLSRETLRELDGVHGGLVAEPVGVVGQPVTFTTSQTISICKYCTTPLDGCPNQTGTIA